MWPARRLLKYGLVAGATVGTLASLKANQYNFDSIGVVRLGRAAFTVFNISVHYKKTLYRNQLDRSSKEYLELKSSVHRKAAEMLLDLCCTNRGVYIKVGQHIGALDYLVPPEYVDTMKVLHSQAPRSTIEEVYRVLREDLKQDPSEIFSHIEEDPQGAASLAQVHKATLKDGTVVAVKVQHPYVKGNSLVDMKTMEALVNLVSWVFPDFKFSWLVKESKRNIPIELDFLNEGHNAEKVSKMFSHIPWLKVPRVYWDLSTSRVLTMEYVEGGQVNDLAYIRANKIDPYEVADKLSQLYSQMIFIHGFVHSDPHPGNILVKKIPKKGLEIILLDHGLYADLSNDFRWEYSKLWFSILNKDKEGMRQHSQNLGVGNLYFLLACMVTGRTWDSIMAGIEKTKWSISEKAQRDKEIPHLLPQISDVLDSINRQMLLILRTNDLMRGVEFTLKAQNRKTSFLVMSRCVIRSVYGERLKLCKTWMSRCRTVMSQQWALFKLSMYYTYLSVLSLPIVSRIFSLANKS
ncbi:aarF domain-containing kinase 1 [Periplaneta americana]|uniref:aarF domain-containing kinase 1 n=1 Tax=Periplaneta americana TaxID=6978 RepID=UPI0037E8CF4A